MFSCGTMRLADIWTLLSTAIPLGKLQKITQEVALATIITLNLGLSLGDARGIRKIKSKKALRCQSLHWGLLGEINHRFCIWALFVNTVSGALCGKRYHPDALNIQTHPTFSHLLLFLQRFCQRWQISVVSFYVLNTCSCIITLISRTCKLKA